MPVFTHDERDIYLPIVLAIAINEGAERVLVGNELDVLSKMRGSDVDLYYDCERPLGSLLSDINEASVEGWDDVTDFLRDAFELNFSPPCFKLSRDCNRLDLEAKALAILEDKYISGNPILMYVALKMWFTYLQFCDKAITQEDLHTNFADLVRSFDELSQRFAELTQYSGEIFRDTNELPQRSNWLTQYYNELIQYYNELSQCFDELTQYYKELVQYYNELVQHPDEFLHYFGELVQYSDELAQYSSELVQYFDEFAQYSDGLPRYSNRLSQYASSLVRYSNKLLLYSDELVQCSNKLSQYSNKLIRHYNELERYSDELFDTFAHLLYPIIYRNKNEFAPVDILTPTHNIFAWPKHKTTSDMQVLVSYPSDSIGTEFAYTYYSSLGLKAYYAQKLYEKRLKVAQCKICSKLFLTRSIAKCLCSKTCEIENAKINRSERWKDPDIIKLDKLTNKERRYWDVHIEKLSADPNVSSQTLEQALAARTAFLNAAKIKRKEVKAEILSLNDFKKWYADQRNVINKYFPE